MKHDGHETDGNCESDGETFHIHNFQNLKQPITEAVASVTADVLGRVWQEMG
jgi:hypothetical protein